MNLIQLQGAVYDHIGLDTSDGLVTPAIVNSRINRAIHAIEGEAAWPWLQVHETIVTSAGVATYTPGAFAPVGTVWLRTDGLYSADTGKNLEWQSRAEVQDRWEPTRMGQPVEFTIDTDLIQLCPTPDGVYNIVHRFIRAEIDLVSNTDTPALPAAYHEAIVEYAAQLCYRRSRETERMQESLNAYVKWIDKMRSRATRRSDMPGKIRVRPGEWF